MSTIFAQPPIMRGRRKSRGSYQGILNRENHPIVARKPVSEDDSQVLRHLVANGAPQNPQFDEPTAYYAEKIVEDGRRPPSRQGFRGGDAFSAYAEDFLLHERFEDTEDEFENPFVSIFDPNARFKDHHGGGLTKRDGDPDNNKQRQRHNPYLPPQLFSPNFSFPSLPPAPGGSSKSQKDLFFDTATRELLARAEEQFRHHFARVTSGPAQHQQQTPQPSTPPGLSIPSIPTRKPRLCAPPAVAPPGVPCGPGPIQRPQTRSLPQTPASAHRGPSPTYIAEPLVPPGLGPFANHKPIPSHPSGSETLSLSPGPHILPDMFDQDCDLDAFLEGVHDMFLDYHRARRLSARATHGTRPGGISNLNLGLSRGSGTATVVPTHFNPLRRVSGAEVWLNVIADHVDRLRINKRTSRADKKPHYLAMVFASYSGVGRPPRVMSPFLLRLETD